MHAAITSYFDVAQITLYLFWGLLAAVIYYLHRENKREGYPLVSDRSEYITVQGYPAIPEPKSFHLADGSTVQKPDARSGDNRPVKATPAEAWPGAPLVPTGNPMLDGVGPASYAERLDIPDTTTSGATKIVPLRQVASDGFHIDHNDPDPRGMPVVGADGVTGGIVRDIWLDRAEHMIRYLEVEVSSASGKRNVLLPTAMIHISGSSGTVKVQSILGSQFAHVPSHKAPDIVTRLEEDKICAYYAGGNLYATPDRAEPVL